MSTGLSIERFSPDTAKALTTWRYPAPFDLYDSDPDDVDLYLRSEESGAGYWSVLNERRELIGFCCFGAEARVRGQDAIEETVDVGGGVRPDVVSLGIQCALPFRRNTLPCPLIFSFLPSFLV
jgi:hypothetical protein